jgi:UrcA family protein
MHTRVAHFALALATAGILAVAAQAGELDQKSVNVNYSDLNLLSAAGHASLMARIDAAADEVCAPVGGKELQAIQAYRACRAGALKQAMPAAHAALAAAEAKSQLAADTTQEPAGRNASR